MCTWYEISSTQTDQQSTNQLTSIDNTQSEELDRGRALLITNKPRVTYVLSMIY